MLIISEFTSFKEGERENEEEGEGGEEEGEREGGEGEEEGEEAAATLGPSMRE